MFARLDPDVFERGFLAWVQTVLLEAIATLFNDPPWRADEWPCVYASVQTVDKGHGRVETRALKASPSLNSWLDWPEVGQVLRRTRRRVHQRGGEVQEQVTIGITSVPFDPVGTHHVETYCRGHWSIENRVHHVRDVTIGEDGGQAHTGATVQVLATRRNAILNLLRPHGSTNIADAVRHIAASPRRALDLIGIGANGL